VESVGVGAVGVSVGDGPVVGSGVGAGVESVGEFLQTKSQSMMAHSSSGIRLEQSNEAPAGSEAEQTAQLVH
jgi:hypothetical protein